MEYSLEDEQLPIIANKQRVVDSNPFSPIGAGPATRRTSTTTSEQILGFGAELAVSFRGADGGVSGYLRASEQAAAGYHFPIRSSVMQYHLP